MINLKTKEEIKVMAEGGKILAGVRRRVAEAVRIGARLDDLNTLAEKLIREAGAEPAFLGYQPSWSDKKYPATICASLNEVVVHGLPGIRKLREGDLLKIDFGVLYKNFYTDTAITVAVGDVSAQARKLMAVTEGALEKAIEECRAGKTLGDIGYIINDYAQKNNFRPVRGLTGHGIGRALHEEPSVLNEGRRGHGLELKEGMVLALEPMLSAGGANIVELPDGGFATKDGSLTAHFEHTVAITKDRPQVLTL